VELLVPEVAVVQTIELVEEVVLLLLVCVVMLLVLLKGLGLYVSCKVAGILLQTSVRWCFLWYLGCLFMCLGYLCTGSFCWVDFICWFCIVVFFLIFIVVIGIGRLSLIGM
jgi:hypothetical protein